MAELKNLFTLTATRYALFEVLKASPMEAAKGGEIAMRLLTNKGDSIKAEAAARELLTVEKDLLKKWADTPLTLQVGKPLAEDGAEVPSDIVSTAYEYHFTIKQLIVRAKAIIQLREAAITPKVLREGAKSASRKQGKGLAAGLLD